VHRASHPANKLISAELIQVPWYSATKGKTMFKKEVLHGFAFIHQ
jgi:hypothetical protein